MISKLSNRITQKLLKRNVIPEEDQELYAYGLFMIISYSAFFLIAIVFGVILNIAFSSIIFFISFCLIRNYAEGIHANSEIKCSIITTLSILISEILIRIFIDYCLVWAAFVMLIISSICLTAIKPVAASQKEISAQERFNYHKKVILLTFSALIISIVGIVLPIHNVTISLSIGLSLASVLLVVGKINHIKSGMACDRSQLDF